MKSQEIKKEADIKRSEVKKAVAILMGLPENVESNLANKAVDDLVVCLILEITSMQAEAQEAIRG